MSWRNQGITGSNNIPLGNRRRFGGGDSTPSNDDSSYHNQSDAASGVSDAAAKRGRSPVRGEFCTSPNLHFHLHLHLHINSPLSRA
jgi:splicing factor 1